MILKLEELENKNIDDFSLKRINNNIFKLRYENDDFIIDPETKFENCNMYENNGLNKLRIILNDNVHEKFINIINNIIYDKVSELIENEDNFTSQVYKPLSLNKTNKMKYFYGKINNKTLIKTVDEDDLLKIEILKNKVFDTYPFINCPIINISNSNVYINFSLHLMFIKIRSNNIIDYNKVKQIMNK